MPGSTARFPDGAEEPSSDGSTHVDFERCKPAEQAPWQTSFWMIKDNVPALSACSCCQLATEHMVIGLKAMEGRQENKGLRGTLGTCDLRGAKSSLARSKLQKSWKAIPLRKRTVFSISSVGSEEFAKLEFCYIPSQAIAVCS